MWQVPTSKLAPNGKLVSILILVPGLGGINLKADIRLYLDPWFQVGTKYIDGTHFEAGANLKAGTGFEGVTNLIPI